MDSENYYSIIPDRSTAIREVWKYWLRRAVFYIYLVSFIIPIVHNIDKNKKLVRVIHGAAFTGSFIVAVLAALLVSVFNPHFIHDRAQKENHSVPLAWLLTVWLHWIPPIILSLDLYLHRTHLRRRHRLDIFSIFQGKTNFDILKQLLKILWLFLSPLAVIGLWFAFGNTPDSVYGATYGVYYIGVPITIAIDVICTAFLAYYVSPYRKTQYNNVNV